MCGLAAIYNYNRPINTTAINDWLKAAQNQLRNRGPDGEGHWVAKDKNAGLAHCRLAIIDLSTAASQPMASLDGNLRIAFNGEIYNYRSIREKLKKRGYRFFSNSDTEVILNLYEAEGLDFLKELRGMYAFALWDERKGGLLLARDPLGIKPLYYSDDGNTVRAASQVKSILAAGEIDTSPEPAGHIGFFLFGYVPEPFTLYRGIRALPAGSALWFEKNYNKPNSIFFYNIPKTIEEIYNKRIDYSKDSIEERIESVLNKSVRYHLISDVPVGLFLSSGLDSSTIAFLASNNQPEPLNTFTIGFEQYKGTQFDEVVFAERIANKLNSSHKTQWITQKDFESDFKNFFEAMDQPSIDGANTYFVGKLASKNGLKVALSGLGGDELFGGYPSFLQVPKIASFTHPFSAFGKHFRLLSANVIKKFSSPKLASLFEYGGTIGGAYFLRRGLFMPWELQGILDPEMVKQGWERLDPVVRFNKEIETIDNNYHRVFALESIFYMRNQLLRDADWAGMAHSLEIRLPLVDVDLFDNIIPLMAHFKSSAKKKMAMSAWKEIPSYLLKRPKTGFCFPVKSWILENIAANERGLRGWARLVYKEYQQYQ